MITDAFISARHKFINQVLLFMTATLICTTTGIKYVKGGNAADIPIDIFYILSYYFYGRLMSSVCFYLIRFSKKIRLASLPLLTMAVPFTDLYLLMVEKSVYKLNFFSDISIMLSIICEMIAVLAVLAEIKNIPQAFSLQRVENLQSVDPPKTQKDETDKLIFTVNNTLGQGDSALDRIIRSIVQRAEASRRNIFFTIVAIAGIVIVGITFSVGMTAYNQVSKVRELEKTRKEMLNLIDQVKALDTTNTETLKSQLEVLVGQNYGKANTYQQTLQNIENQTVVSWPDIAMRITIAALTLFLVQVFFNIYKYNQQQVSNLLTRAETLELFRENGADQEALRNGLLGKLDTNPSFDKTPNSPVDQIINVISKAKE